MKSAKVLVAEWNIKIFHIYVIESLKTGKRYTGFIGKMPEERLKEHNAGFTIWTRKNKPFKIIYSEVFETEKLARKREKYLKSGKGRKFIDSLIPA